MLLHGLPSRSSSGVGLLRFLVHTGYFSLFGGPVCDVCLMPSGQAVVGFRKASNRRLSSACSSRLPVQK